MHETIEKIFPQTTNFPSPLLTLQCQRGVGLVGIGSEHSFAFGVFQHVTATHKARWPHCVTRWRDSAPVAGTLMVSAAATVWLGILGFHTAVLVRVMATPSFVTQWPERAWTAVGLQLEAAVKGKLIGSTEKLTQRLVLSETHV